MRLTAPAVTIALLSALALSGCHSMTRVALPGSTPPPPNAAVLAQLKAGGDVQLRMRTGDKVELTLAEVQSEGLVAEGGRHILFHDMAQVEKRHISWTKVGILTGSILGFLAYFVTHF